MSRRAGYRGHIAVLGAGIMGSSTALCLLRAGYRVTLFDEAPAPMSAASRWNEGKIHLGFLYAADPSLRTARQLLEGGLMFQRLVETLLDTSIASGATQEDDLYLVHADSIVSPDAMADYFNKVGALTAAHPKAGEYFGGLAQPRQLTRAAFEAIGAGPEVIAAFAAPERSVDTRVVADRFVEALAGQSALESAFAKSVTNVVCDASAARERWHVMCGALRFGPFDGVVNALWQGLPRIDELVGMEGDRDFSHRFRVSVFVETDRVIAVPSAVLCTGPFGDIKAYPGGRYYLSWYEHGLLATGSALVPPEQPILDGAAKQETAHRILDRLAGALPAIADIRAAAVTTFVEGGWVLALGQGALSDPRSSIHRRNRFGIARRGAYVSVNTGKYSMAPWLAQQVASMFA